MDARRLGGRMLILTGGAGLIGSLFLPWSHQLSAGYATVFGASGALDGLPRDPTAWQVYSAVDVLLALLGATLLTLALIGASSRPAFSPLRSGRVALGVLIACLLAVAFVVHALGAPPTNGVIPATAPGASSPGVGVPANQPTDGVGETVALVALGLAIGGLAVSGRR